LQTAVNSSAGARTIKITGDIDIGAATIDINNKDITIEPLGGAVTLTKTVTSHFFNVTNGGKLTIGSGVTLDGRSNSTSPGVKVDGSSFTLNGTIKNCHITGFGGGIYAQDTTVTITGGKISGNASAISGGGIYAFKLNGAAVPDVTINSGEISGNTAENGGGIYTDDYAKLTIPADAHVKFFGNSADALYKLDTVDKTSSPSGTLSTWAYANARAVNSISVPALVAENFPVSDDKSLNLSAFNNYDINYNKAGGGGGVVPAYAVIFRDYDGTVLKTEHVIPGDAATAPGNPSRSGYTFSGWDKVFDHVTADLTVTAVYAANSGGGSSGGGAAYVTSSATTAAATTEPVSTPAATTVPADTAPATAPALPTDTIPAGTSGDSGSGGNNFAGNNDDGNGNAAGNNTDVNGDGGGVRGGGTAGGAVPPNTGIGTAAGNTAGIAILAAFALFTARGSFKKK